MPYISEVCASDVRGLAQVDALLEREGLRRDRNLDYTCAMFDDDLCAIATGSCYGNTLRCFAVSGEHQGEGLLNEIVTHLVQVQAERGNFHLFLYTKPDAAKFFADLGFHEIARVTDTLVFMENRRDGFASYLRTLETTRRPGKSAALVMNANPFTLGHLFLTETASAACDTLHLFVVSEDASLIPFTVRRRLVRDGTAHLSNVILHDCGPYLISNATFPSYFLPDENTVTEGQARLDVAVFVKIAAALGVTARYAGEEPYSRVTALYNKVMASELPKHGIDCVIIPRKQCGNVPISASTVRQLLQRGDFDALKPLLPAPSYAWLTSPDALPVIERMSAYAAPGTSHTEFTR